MEFSRCVERMTRMIKETTEQQSFERASQILSGKENTEFMDSENSSVTLDPKDIYMRVASNLELIQLYTTVNQQLVESYPRQCSALFRRTTTSLVGIRETLDQLKVQISFKHDWFPKNKPLSYWEFFNRFNLETEKKEQAVNVKKFFLRYQSPIIPQTEENLRNLQRLIVLSNEFSRCVTRSIRSCCCIGGNDVLFGRHDQAKIILKITFEGQQFDVVGPHGNTIDCMFFPCTQKEQVVIEQKK